MSTIGLIGLGIMGQPMPGHLLAGSRRLFAHTNSGVPQALLGDGADQRANGREVGQNPTRPSP